MRLISFFCVLTFLSSQLNAQDLIQQECYKIKKGICQPRLELFKLSDSTFHIKRYTQKGNLYLEMTKHNKDAMVLDGHVKFYSSSGILQSEGGYANDVISGDWKLYDKTGRLTREISYDNFSPPDTLTIFEEIEFFGASQEQQPKFQGGGKEKFREYISKEMFYPPTSEAMGASGRCIVQFAIDEHGNVVDVALVSGIEPSLNQEAIRIIKSSPSWTPGYKDGKPVKMQITLPVLFLIQ